MIISLQVGNVETSETAMDRNPVELTFTVSVSMRDCITDLFTSWQKSC